MKWLGIVPTLIGITALFSGIVTRNVLFLVLGVVLSIAGCYWLFSSSPQPQQ